MVKLEKKFYTLRRSDFDTNPKTFIFPVACNRVGFRIISCAINYIGLTSLPGIRLRTPGSLNVYDANHIATTNSHIFPIIQTKEVTATHFLSEITQNADKIVWFNGNSIELGICGLNTSFIPTTDFEMTLELEIYFYYN